MINLIKQDLKQWLYQLLKSWIIDVIYRSAEQEEAKRKAAQKAAASSSSGSRTARDQTQNQKALDPKMLIAAAEVGDTVRVRELLAAGADARALVRKGGDGVEWLVYDEPLKRAAANGHIETVRVLLQAGAHVNDSDGWGNGSPIERAAATGQTEVVKLLVLSGANVRIKDDIALRVAAEKGHTETVSALLVSGADVHAKAALHQAAENGHVETVGVLLQAGARVDGWARYTNSSSQIVEGAAIELAAAAGRAAVVKLLLDAGADVHIRNDNALRLSQEKGHAEVAEVLLAGGATQQVWLSARERMDAELKKARKVVEWQRALTRAAEHNLDERVSELLAGRPRKVDYRFVSNALKKAAGNGNAPILTSILAAVAEDTKAPSADSTPTDHIEARLAEARKTAYIGQALEIAEDLGHAQAAEILRSTISTVTAAANVEPRIADQQSATFVRPKPRQRPGQSFGFGSA